MNVHKTKIKDCFLLEPQLFKDDRGFFMESFNARTFKKLTRLEVNFVQDNMSQSNYGVIRGLHAQRGEHAQAKLVSVLEGEVLDVAVDLRADSNTYGNVVTAILNTENRHQLFVPRGCFHGFAVLSKTATFFYKCDNFYNKEADYGVRHDETSFQIDWKIPVDQRVLSEKDLNLPTLVQLK
ncbi:dTDP-4-dehydrorhamnose 3,5-epimerase [Nonlabens sp.]|uniref:dTDP-4-dehydrorhamnose 3,5-epimerase n=1 Tax=Nonlabens sp. TaxID=1888209 RepID=UPI003F6A123A